MGKHRYLPPRRGNPRNIFGSKYEHGFYYIAECTCGIFATGATKTSAIEKLNERHLKLRGRIPEYSPLIAKT